MPTSSRDEFANALSHGIGLVAAVAATPFLIVSASDAGAASVVGSSIFGGTLILLYLASTLYHATPTGGLKEAFKRLDHLAIYLLIAGTYTPFTLGALRGTWGWTLFGIVWSAAVIGASAKLAWGNRYPRLSTALYLAMGWLIVVGAGPLVENVPATGVLWLVAGGVLYTSGVWFYVRSERRYHHLAWHLFVIGGSVCHYVAVLRYAA